MSFHAGTSRVNITPPIGIWMTGFASRANAAMGIHDELYARALVVEHNGSRVAIVALDIIQPDPEIVHRARQLVDEWTGIPAHGLLLNSSHTHSGPTTCRFHGMGIYDEGYCEVLARKIATAVKLAEDALQPARLSFGREPVVAGFDRRLARRQQQAGPEEKVVPHYDANVYVLRFEFADGGNLVAAHHAAHPVVLRQDNIEYSADYCGPLCQTVEDGLGPCSRAMFLQGCAGNINADTSASTFEHAARIGRRLGAAALKAASKAEPVKVTRIDSLAEIVELPLQAPPTEKEAAEQLERMEKELESARSGADGVKLRVARGMADWARMVLERAESGRSDWNLPIQVQCVRLGEVALAGTGAETFLRIGQAIQQQSPFKHTLALGYTNGCIGYLPDAESFPFGGYEVETAIRYYGTLPLAPECGETVIDRSVRMLERLAAD